MRTIHPSSPVVLAQHYDSSHTDSNIESEAVFTTSDLTAYISTHTVCGQVVLFLFAIFCIAVDNVETVYSQLAILMLISLNIGCYMICSTREEPLHVVVTFYL